MPRMSKKPQAPKSIIPKEAVKRGINQVINKLTMHFTDSKLDIMLIPTGFSDCIFNHVISILMKMMLRSGLFSDFTKLKPRSQTRSRSKLRKSVDTLTKKSSRDVDKSTDFKANITRDTTFCYPVLHDFLLSITFNYPQLAFFDLCDFDN
ncbi:hypothetical protein Glove_309g25 [Diversispora epigaea]|uniref:Uncharacterized protein n=1 Tax=Diversispora epigaea TaxID=1348612 RepID=A0A397HT78_9GLOM|nr:hypothetical protein Glove_309g25 [Diversispora epigaea]